MTEAVNPNTETVMTFWNTEALEAWWSSPWASEPKERE